MRKKANLLKSNRSRTRSTSLNDLVTQSEQTMSSQASIYTNTSKNSQRTSRQMAQSSAFSQDFDDYEDIIADDIDTLFITPEEEKKIQNILQFARKGKINPGNAFEIPVRVIDPQLTEGSNMRFWKFASELLFASMSIYDKRVENMFQTTNRMFDNLIRVQGRPNQPLTDEQVEERHRKQRGELIQMEVGDVGKVQTLSSYEIGSVNCEQQQKINIKNPHNQFLPDPLFQKRLQAFDSNTLKSLFMNVFESGEDLQVTFFNKENKKEQQVKIENQVKVEEKFEEQMEQFQERFPKFIHSELQNFSSHLSMSSVFNDMDNFKKENVRQAIENNRYEVKDFIQELKMFSKDELQGNNQNSFLGNNESEATQTNSVYSFQGDRQFNFQFNMSENTQFTSEHPSQSQSAPNTFAYSARQEPISQFYIDEGDQNFTQMTPWELEFKGMKLQRRVVKRGENKRPRQRNGPKLATEEHQINFLDGKTEVRSRTFGQSKPKITNTKENCTDTNILPKSMNPFTEALKRHRMLHKTDNVYINRQLAPESANRSQSIPENDVGNGDDQPPQLDNFMNLNASFQQETLTQRTNFESNVVQQQHESQGLVYRSTGIRNIREIKEKIYKHILEGKSVRLSELNINIAPSSILIIFLHLVNENSINITSIDDEHDLEISPKNQ